MESVPFAPRSAPTVSPSRKRTRAALKTTTKASDDQDDTTPEPRRLRMRIDHSERIWIGRCGCKSPHCRADEIAFSSDTGVSDESDESDHDHDSDGDGDGDSGRSRSKRPPQDPADLVPMMLHLMLMM